jgi:hypothetical protein
LRALPPDPAYGSGVNVVIHTDSGGPRYDPEDVMAGAWALRAAVLAKAAGVGIDSVGVAYERPSGEIAMSFVEPVDKTIAADWYEPAGLTLDQVVERTRALATDALAGTAYSLDSIRATVDTDGTRVLWATLTVASIAAADDYNAGGNALAIAVDKLNAENQAKIGVRRIDVFLPTGEPVTSTLTDLQLDRGTAWLAAGVTLEGPTPVTREAP